MNANFSQVDEEGAWAGKVQMAFIVADCAVLLVTFVFGSAANVFVMHAVRRHKSLRTATNALLVNLALVDLLRCATDCPMLLLIVLRARARADLGLALCVAQLACFSLNCCAQLLTVAGISVERHRAVTRPFEGGGGGDRRRRVAALIPFTWAAPALASTLCALFTRDSPVYGRCRGVRAYEFRTHGSFGRYVLLPAWCTCLAVIAVCYAHIFVVVRAHSRKIFDKGVSPGSRAKDEQKDKKGSGTKGDAVIAHETDKPHAATEINWAVDAALPNGDPGAHKSTDPQTGSAGQTPPTSAKDSTTSVPELRENAHKLPDVESEESPTAQSASATHQNSHAQQERATETAPELTDTEADSASPEKLDAHDNAQQDAHGGAPQKAAENVHHDAQQEVHETAPQELHESAFQDAQQKAPENAPESAPQGEEVMGAVCMMPSFANRERVNKKKKESKLAKRSGYIIFTFLIFWLPLIGTIVLSVFQDRNEISAGGFVQLELEVLAVCIACMTSLTNPIIYAAVNPQFRNEFYYLKKKFQALCAKS